MEGTEERVGWLVGYGEGIPDGEIVG